MQFPAVAAQPLAPISWDQSNELTEAYLRALDASELTKSLYRNFLKNGWWAFMEKRKIQQPTREHFIDFKKFLLSDYSPCTVSSYLTAARGFFRFLNETLRYPDITVGVKGVRMQRGFRRDPVPLDKARELLHSIDRSTLLGKRDYALASILLRTGPRTIEVVRADFGDVRRVSCQRVLYLQGKGHDAKDAYVLLTDPTWEALYDYLKARGPLREGDPLFHSLSDRDAGKIRRISTRTVRRVFKQLLRGVNVDDPRVSTHSARHFAATASLQSGGTLEETRQLLRHSSLNQVLTYAHHINRVEHAPEPKIDALIDQTQKTAKEAS